MRTSTCERVKIDYIKISETKLKLTGISLTRVRPWHSDFYKILVTFVTYFIIAERRLKLFFVLIRTAHRIPVTGKTVIFRCLAVVKARSYEGSRFEFCRFSYLMLKYARKETKDKIFNCIFKSLKSNCKGAQISLWSEAPLVEANS